MSLSMNLSSKEVLERLEEIRKIEGLPTKAKEKLDDLIRFAGGIPAQERAQHMSMFTAGMQNRLGSEGTKTLSVEEGLALFRELRSHSCRVELFSDGKVQSFEGEAGTDSVKQWVGRRPSGDNPLTQEEFDDPNNWAEVEAMWGWGMPEGATNLYVLLQDMTAAEITESSLKFDFKESHGREGWIKIHFDGLGKLRETKWWLR